MRRIGVPSLARAVGTSGATDIPTPHESGLKNFAAVQWYGLLAHANTPRDMTGKIHRDASAILKMPEVRDRLSSDGAIIIASTSARFAAFIKSEMTKRAKMVRAAGIVPE